MKVYIKAIIMIIIHYLNTLKDLQRDRQVIQIGEKEKEVEERTEEDVKTEEAAKKE